MVRSLKYLGTVFGCIAIGCGNPSPRVVTVVVPYTPELPLPELSVWRGAADCDLNGMPVTYLHPDLTGDLREWTRTHERIHVLQMGAWGGCSNFAKRVRADSMFRLHIEAEAYCGVLLAQRGAHVKPDPTYWSIVAQLADDYGHKYVRDTVVAAMPCQP